MLCFVPRWSLASSLAGLWRRGYVGEVCSLVGPVELLAQLLPDGVVLSYTKLGPQERHPRERVSLPHELQQLEDDVVVVAQEASPVGGGDVRVGLQDAIEHSDHLVFGLAFDVRWLLPVIAKVM